MTKEPGRSYTQKSLAKRVLTAAAVFAVSAFSSVYTSGCNVELYVPATRCPDFQNRFCSLMDSHKSRSSHNEDNFCCLPIGVITCGCKDSESRSR
jgi:hypothetical protein